MSYEKMLLILLIFLTLCDEKCCDMISLLFTVGTFVNWGLICIKRRSFIIRKGIKCFNTFTREIGMFLTIGVVYCFKQYMKTSVLPKVDLWTEFIFYIAVYSASPKLFSGYFGRYKVYLRGMLMTILLHYFTGKWKYSLFIPIGTSLEALWKNKLPSSVSKTYGELLNRIPCRQCKIVCFPATLAYLPSYGWSFYSQESPDEHRDIHLGNNIFGAGFFRRFNRVMDFFTLATPDHDIPLGDNAHASHPVERPRDASDPVYALSHFTEGSEGPPNDFGDSGIASGYPNTSSMAPTSTTSNLETSMQRENESFGHEAETYGQDVTSSSLEDQYAIGGNVSGVPSSSSHGSKASDRGESMAVITYKKQVYTPKIKDTNTKPASQSGNESASNSAVMSSYTHNERDDDFDSDDSDQS